MRKVADAFRRPSVLIGTPAHHSTSPHQYGLVPAFFKVSI